MIDPIEVSAPPTITYAGLRPMPAKRITTPSENSTRSGTTSDATARTTTPNSVLPTRTAARSFGVFPVERSTR
jgi:hypothetical protein